MKKVLLFVTVFLLSVTLVACTGDAEEQGLPALPETVDMSNVDDYLGRNDVQYVDLRNWDEKMATGYIEGFEVIPFFDYLESQEFLVRTDGDWTYATEDLGSQSALENLFNADKAIFLMCGSGTRAGYVKAALEALGYDNVYNVGGFSAYTGTNKVLGDGGYTVAVVPAGELTPGTYFAATADNYYATLVVNSEGGIEALLFDAVYCKDTNADGIKEECNGKQDLADGYGMRTDEGLTWAEAANVLSDAIVANQGWSADWAITLGGEGEHDYFDLTDQDVIDAVASVTMGIDGLKEVYDLVIAAATPAE